MTAGSRTRPTPSAGARNGKKSIRSRARRGATPTQLTGAVYLTLTIDEDKARAEERMNAFMQNYYGQPASVMRARQASYAGPAEGATEWLSSWVRAGVGHLVLRFAGDGERHLEAIAALRSKVAG